MLVTLLWTLLRIARPKFVLVQNPPSIPTLAVAWFVCRVRGSKLVVDWHNFGFSIVALSVRNQTIVGLTKRYEKWFGALGDAHLCVSRSMQRELERNWGISKVCVLHDCPPEFFCRATLEQRRQLFASEPLKQLVDLRDDTLVAVTATSFTKDEKLDMLLDAIELLDQRARNDASFPKAAFVVTGKGDGRAAFEARAARLQFAKCSVTVTYFDKFSDYAVMLGSADLGLSFHASSSGFDLPMKIVDMFGCGLCVCSIDYACIEELVQDRVNGRIFQNAETLAAQLYELFGSKQSELARLRQGVKTVTWDASWNSACLPVLKAL